MKSTRFVLSFDKFTFSSEHGPKGGDEINLIRLDKKMNYKFWLSSIILRGPL